MDGGQWLWIIVILAAALIILFLAFNVLAAGLIGAALILGFAARQGFVGVVFFFAAWVFLFPLMAVWAVVWGFIEAGKQGGAKPQLRSSLRNKRAARTDRTPPPTPVKGIVGLIACRPMTNEDC